MEKHRNKVTEKLLDLKRKHGNSKIDGELREYYKENPNISMEKALEVIEKRLYHENYHDKESAVLARSWLITIYSILVGFVSLPVFIEQGVVIKNIIFSFLYPIIPMFFIVLSTVGDMYFLNKNYSPSRFFEAVFGKNKDK